MNPQEARTNSVIAGIFSLIWLALALSLGGIYVYTGWTPLCERLGTVFLIATVLGCFFAAAISDPPDDNEEDAEDTDG